MRQLFLSGVLFLALNAAPFAQSPLYIHPRETWMQSITILGNESKTFWPGRRPFSAVEESMYVHKLEDGTLDARSSITTYFYCDRYGRTRAERHVTSYNNGKEQSWLASIYIADQVAGFLYRLDPQNHIATRWAWDLASREAAEDREREWPGEHSTAAIKEAESQVKTTYLGISTREGLTVDGWRQTVSLPAGADGNPRPYDIVVESWISRELKVTVSSTRDTGTTMRETRMTEISRSEPDKSLFTIPAGYKIEDAPDPDSLSVSGPLP